TTDRPHRKAALLEVPAEVVPVPKAKLEGLAATVPMGSSSADRPCRKAALVEAPTDIELTLAAPIDVPATQTSVVPGPQPQEYAWVEERVARARAYVAKVDPAISGQHGHDQTYYVAALLTRDFDLSEADALLIMEEFNARCQPPWTHEELVR